MQNIPGITKAQAYDKARKEFYAIRRQDELVQKVQREEALWTGAQFGLSALEAGLVVEDKEFERWKIFAAKEAQALQTRQSAAFANSIDDAAEDEDEANLGQPIPPQSA
jgi:small subunit ribosomal protein S23